jgi:hypothetical protein
MTKQVHACRNDRPLYTVTIYRVPGTVGNTNVLRECYFLQHFSGGPNGHLETLILRVGASENRSVYCESAQWSSIFKNEFLLPNQRSHHK